MYVYIYIYVYVYEYTICCLPVIQSFCALGDNPASEIHVCRTASSDRMYQHTFPGTHECHNANRDLIEKKRAAPGSNLVKSKGGQVGQHICLLCLHLDR